jgi:hypothetical protein
MPVGSRDMRGLDFFENMLPEGSAPARMATLPRLALLRRLTGHEYSLLSWHP